MQQPLKNKSPHRNSRFRTWQKISRAGRVKRTLSAGKLNANVKRMKNFIQVFVIFSAAIFCFSGCGKKAATPEKSIASYPLPEPPWWWIASRAIWADDLLFPKSAIRKHSISHTANESSSMDIYRFHVWGLLEL
jgi:hypothetical protein